MLYLPSLRLCQEKILPNAGETSLNGERKSVRLLFETASLVTIVVGVEEVARKARVDIFRKVKSTRARLLRLAIMWRDVGQCWGFSSASSFSSTSDPGVSTTSAVHALSSAETVEERAIISRQKKWQKDWLVIRKASPEYHAAGCKKGGYRGTVPRTCNQKSIFKDYDR